MVGGRGGKTKEGAASVVGEGGGGISWRRDTRTRANLDERIRANASQCGRVALNPPVQRTGRSRPRNENLRRSWEDKNSCVVSPPLSDCVGFLRVECACEGKKQRRAMRTCRAAPLRSPSPVVLTRPPRGRYASSFFFSLSRRGPSGSFLSLK